jgi:hypothetical protein
MVFKAACSVTPSMLGRDLKKEEKQPLKNKDAGCKDKRFPLTWGLGFFELCPVNSSTNTMDVRTCEMETVVTLMTVRFLCFV